MKPFTVNAEWIEYAHGPGAKDGQPRAKALCELLRPGNKSIALTDRVHVAEVMSVAELYRSDTSVQDDERLWFHAYPRQLIKRAKAWLAEYDAERSTMIDGDTYPALQEDWQKQDDAE